VFVAAALVALLGAALALFVAEAPLRGAAPREAGTPSRSAAAVAAE
jgi:hypothetical protein